jgi:hypothetical protein
MNPKDLFQTAIRVAGAVFLYFSIPRALGDLLTLPDTFHMQSAIGILGAIFRILWETVVPLWMLAGAPALTRKLYPTG